MVSRVTSHAGNAGAGTVIAVDPLHPPPQALALAGQLIREGKLVAFPTETVYGLGANAYDDAAVRRVFAAKGRASDDPLIVHLATTAELEAVAEVPGELRAVVQALAARFWPGPLTVVLPKSARIPPSVTAGLPTVAVRVPSHAVAQGVLRAAGVPIAAPSANTFTRTSATAAAHVVEDLGPRVDLVLDGGPAPIGIESTVIQLAGGEVRLLRPGAVPPEAIDEVLLQQGLPPTRRVSPASQQSDDRDAAGGAEGGPAPSPAGAEGQTAPRGPAASPGLSPKHYAPRARLLYFSGPPAAAREAMLAAAREALTGGRRVGLLLYHE
ncbi:MAG TPA: L-threonylcarbamoyladenylate synthase, partial [Chloroflexota bacterium]|nr:L-threonylcarbamoyladenylate synthase [Chloroflexota bacterium]